MTTLHSHHCWNEKWKPRIFHLQYWFPELALWKGCVCIQDKCEKMEIFWQAVSFVFYFYHSDNLYLWKCNWKCLSDVTSVFHVMFDICECIRNIQIPMDISVYVHVHAHVYIIYVCIVSYSHKHFEKQCCCS